MSRHTPGPWVYEPGDKRDDMVGLYAAAAFVTHVDSQGDTIDVCQLLDPCFMDDREPADEHDDCLRWSGSAEANGRLIAAAPDLLAVCLRAVESVGPKVDGDYVSCESCWEGSPVGGEVAHAADCLYVELRKAIDKATKKPTTA